MFTYYTSLIEGFHVTGRSEQALKVIRQILRRTELHSRDLARAAGLTATQRMLLEVLEDAGEARAGVVAARMGITQATTTNLLDRLERVGLIERRRFDSDKRQVWVSLTDEGRSRLSLAPDALQERFANRFDGLKSWEQSMVLASLERVSEMLGAENLDTAPVLDAGVIDREVPSAEA